MSEGCSFWEIITCIHLPSPINSMRILPLLGPARLLAVVVVVVVVRLVAVIAFVNIKLTKPDVHPLHPNNSTDSATDSDPRNGSQLALARSPLMFTQDITRKKLKNAGSRSSRAFSFNTHIPFAFLSSHSSVFTHTLLPLSSDSSDSLIP